MHQHLPSSTAFQPQERLNSPSNRLNVPQKIGNEKSFVEGIIAAIWLSTV
jgi:hypothetical protein